MPNWCNNELIVIGPENQIAAFEEKHKQYLADPDLEVLDSSRKPGQCGMFFQSPWNPGLNEVAKASKEFRELTFLLAFWEIGIGFRGQGVFRNGAMLETIQRPYGPDGDVMYDQSHPLVDLFGNYLEAQAREIEAPTSISATEPSNEETPQSRLEAEMLAALEGNKPISQSGE
jgi:hypothetical protein